MADFDVASVRIEPNLDRFESEVRRGLDDAFDGVDPTVRELVSSIEQHFESLADAIHADFRELGADIDGAMHHVANTVEDVGIDIRTTLERSTEAAERSFDELRRAATRDLERIQREAHQTGASVSGSFRGLFAGAAIFGGVAAATAGLGLLTSFGLQSAGALEQVQIQFNSLLGSAEKGESVFRDLQQFAAATPFEFVDVSHAAARFLAFDDAVGISDDQLQSFLTTVGNVISVTGGGAQALDTVTLAMGQIASSGKLTLDNLNQISEAMPGFSAVAAIASAEGLTTAQVMEKISKGEIGATEGINDLLAGMAKFPGAAGAMEAQSQTLLGVFSTFKDTVSMTLSDAFTPVIPAIKEALTEITPIVGDALKTLAPALGGILTSLLTALGPLITGLSNVLTPLLNALAPAFNALVPALGPLGEALTEIAVALAPILPLTAQLVATLVAALAPAISSLEPAITGLIQGLDALIQPLLPLIEQLGPILASVILPIALRLGDVFAQLGEALGPILAAAVEALMPLLDQLGPIIVELLSGFEPLLPVIGELAPVVVELLVALTPLIELVAQLLTLIVSVQTPLIEIAASFVAWLAIDGIIPLLSTLVGWIGDLLELLDPVIGKLSEFTDFISNMSLSDVGDTVTSEISDIWDAIVGFVSDIPDKIGDLISSIPDIFANVIRSAGDAAFYAIGYAIGLIINAVTGLPGFLHGIFTSAWHGAVAAVTGALDFIIATVRDLPARLGALLTNLINTVRGFFLRVGSQAVDAIRPMPGQLLEIVKSLPKKIIDTISDLPNRLYQLGRDIILGLIHGIESMITGAINAVKNALNRVVQGAKDAIGAHSPSRKFAELGEWSVEGYQQGVENNVSNVHNAVARILTPPAPGTTMTSYANAGVQLAAGAVQVIINGAAAGVDGYELGTQVARGITDHLSDPAFTSYRRPRTT